MREKAIKPHLGYTPTSPSLTLKKIMKMIILGFLSIPTTTYGKKKISRLKKRKEKKIDKIR